VKDNDASRVVLVLPLPPSVNGYWRSVPATRNHRARVLISEEGRRFKDRCRLAAIAQCRTPLTGDLSITATVYFRDHRRDLDNVFKPLLDALQGAAYANDRQIVHLDFRKALDKARPRVELTIQEAAA
jgi:crossover junction endodeoxyribonuclease RusA